MYSASLESLRSHPVPDWFHDAKFGIFVHWGLYSVPAWAPSVGAVHDVKVDNPEEASKYTPYAEWYLNALRLRDSPTRTHHASTYGANFPYSGFREPFEQGLRAWDPHAWAETFAASGARYVVLTTKHHDGYLLWPSNHPPPHQPDWCASRDAVGDLADASRRRGLRFGVYYSAGLDWSFTPVGSGNLRHAIETAPHDEAYNAYVLAHFREMIDRYAPDYLWNDICYPRREGLLELLAEYYNTVESGLVNDRWRITDELVRDAHQMAAYMSYLSANRSLLQGDHYDVLTPEYGQFDTALSQKWETCRGVGLSFGYKKTEEPEDLMSSEEIIHLLVDIVSKNGNLLLNTGPRADGTLCPMQAERLVGVGAWLEVWGDAIYGTRPWRVSHASTPNGRAVRFTRKGDDVYAIVLGGGTGPIVLPDAAIQPSDGARILGGAPVDCERDGSLIRLAGAFPDDKVGFALVFPQAAARARTTA